MIKREVIRRLVRNERLRAFRLERPAATRRTV